ncbi:MAG: ABC transporter permease [Eubacteriales bacterium]|nr:ABC transporter permease [Eubacteriales bacterium]
MDFLLNIIEQGLIYGILALGVYITYKILDFPDLSVDGSFPLGGAVAAVCITNGMNPYLTLPVTFLAGMAAGAFTGLVHVKCRVRDLLSGIVTMTALYSVNLLVAGSNNVPLFSQDTIFRNSALSALFGEKIPTWFEIALLLVIVLILKILLDLYLQTKSGYLLRAVGDNPALVTALAKDKGNVKILGLAISNGLVALSGCIFAQQARVFDISSGTGTLVIGLASVIIGFSFFGKFGLLKTSTAVILGSIFYKACVALALRFTGNSTFGTKATKLVTAALFLIILIIGIERKKKVKIHAGTETHS